MSNIKIFKMQAENKNGKRSRKSKYEFVKISGIKLI